MLGVRFSPAEKDRALQIYLAQARGPVRNGDLLRQSVARTVQISAPRSNDAGGMTMPDPLIDMLSFVARALDAEDVKYAVTGSVASSVYGEPRGTQDADLVVVPDGPRLLRAALSLRPRFYAPDDMLADAIRTRGFVNIVDGATGMKVDLSFASNRGMIEQALSRREQHTIGSDSPPFWFVTVEDLILMKLSWRKDTQSTRQWGDLLAVCRIRGVQMDWRYLREQADRFNLTGDLVRLRDEAGI